MEKHRLRVLIDVDDVVANFVEELLRWYDLDYDDFLKPSDITEWDLFKFINPKSKEKFSEYFKNKNLYKSVKPVPDALKNIKLISELDCNVFYCTSVVPGGEGIKYDWLINNKFLPPFLESKHQYIEITEKYLLDGDRAVIIDDGFHNVENFKGHKILFKRPWNETQYKNTDIPINYTNDWNEIYKIIQKLI